MFIRYERVHVHRTSSNVWTLQNSRRNQGVFTVNSINVEYTIFDGAQLCFAKMF